MCAALSAIALPIELLFFRQRLLVLIGPPVLVVYIGGAVLAGFLVEKNKKGWVLGTIFFAPITLLLLALFPERM